MLVGKKIEVGKKTDPWRVCFRGATSSYMKSYGEQPGYLWMKNVAFFFGKLLATAKSEIARQHGMITKTQTARRSSTTKCSEDR